VTNDRGIVDDIYWDPFDPKLRDDPYPLWKRMRDEAPLYHNERHDFWVLSRYADVEAAHKDHKTYSSAHNTTIEMMVDEPNVDSGMFIGLDPPTHTQYRGLVSRAFTPRRIAGIEDDIRQIARDLLDAQAGSGRFDYVQDFAAILPPTVISTLLGVPAADQAWLRHQIDLMFHIEGDVGMMNPIAQNAGAEVRRYILGQVEERRVTPRDDLFTVLAEADFPRAEIPAEFGTMLFAAGSETVARLLGWAISLLAKHPDQRAELAADPSLLPGAVEEMLRIEPPSPVQARWTTSEIQLHGRTMPVDSKVVLLTGAAVRDERKFPDPDRFDIHRRFDHHVSLGLGIHFCLGAALARMEGRIGIEETLLRFPDYEVDAGAASLLYTSTVRGYDKLPILT
jgi:cytochrome P450